MICSVMRSISLKMWLLTSTATEFTEFPNDVHDGGSCQRVAALKPVKDDEFGVADQGVSNFARWRCRRTVRFFVGYVAEPNEFQHLHRLMFSSPSCRSRANVRHPSVVQSASFLLATNQLWRKVRFFQVHATTTSPALGRSLPIKSLNKVDLPAPFIPECRSHRRLTLLMPPEVMRP